MADSSSPSATGTETPHGADHAHGPPRGEPRRGFLAKLGSIIFGGIAGLVPLGAGLMVFFDPLRRKTDTNTWLRVATLNSIPADGVARYYPVVTDREDAWNTYFGEPIGAVFLRRLPDSDDIECFNAICPHAGCFVNFNAPAMQFHCPCHDSKWQPDGARVNPSSCPSPRDLDSLPVDPERLGRGEVWIQFQNFLTATPEKIPKT